MAGTNSVRPMGNDSRDYSGGQFKAAQRFTMRQGDPRVHQLYLDFTTYPRETIYWSFRRKVVDLAQQLFSGNFNWFIRQDTNALITDQNYMFLLDTVRFIATGHRRLSIYTWPTLLSYEVPLGASVDSRKEISDLFIELALNTDVNTIIQKWLSHKNGFNDMMYTLNMLFGNIPEKVSKEEHHDEPVDFSTEAIDKAYDTIEFLTKCHTAVEHYKNRVTSGRTLSTTEQNKMRAQLEKIDRACRLKVSSVGIESHGIASTESFGDRLKQLGSTILNWLIELIEKIEVYTQKYTTGITSILSRFHKIENILDQGYPLQASVIKRVPGELYHDGVFVGDTITADETALLTIIKNSRQQLIKNYSGKLRDILRSGLSEETNQAVVKLLDEATKGGKAVAFKLPGNMVVDLDGIQLSVRDNVYRKANENGENNVPFGMVANSTARQNVRKIVKYVEALDDTQTASTMVSVGAELKRVLIDYQRLSEKNETLVPVYEKIQSNLSKFITYLFQARVYFSVLGDLAAAQNTRAIYYAARITSKNNLQDHL